jgi:hypothetical protein
MLGGRLVARLQVLMRGPHIRDRLHALELVREWLDARRAQSIQLPSARLEQI